MQADFHVFLALFSMHGIAGMKGQRYRGEAWTRLKSDEEFIWNDIGSTLVVRQRTCSREELHCLEKKGEPFLFSFSLCFLLRAFFFSLRPTWREFLVRASREALVPRHFRWWPPTATAKHRAPRTNGSLIDPEMNQEMIFILVRRFLEFFVSPFLCFSSFF